MDVVSYVSTLPVWHVIEWTKQARGRTAVIRQLMHFGSGSDQKLRPTSIGKRDVSGQAH